MVDGVQMERVAFSRSDVSLLAYYSTVL